MPVIYEEENGVYCIDCTNAIWSTNEVNCIYDKGKTFLSDVDFIIETDEQLLLVEYKNVNVPNASNPDGFKPEKPKMIDKVAKKYYDSLHYLALLGKTKPKRFIYVLECVNGDAVLRRRVRGYLKVRLPFGLQNLFSTGIKLIDDVDVLSIDEWNNDSLLSKYPISLVSDQEEDVDQTDDTEKAADMKKADGPDKT